MHDRTIDMVLINKDGTSGHYRYDLTDSNNGELNKTPESPRSDHVAALPSSRWQSSPVLSILSPKVVGVGLNIVAANHVIHLSRWWNPAVEDQCTDRAYRIGQQKDVSVYLPLSTHPAFPVHSFDEKLHDLLERKRSLASGVLVPGETGKEAEQLFSEIAVIVNF